MSGVTVTADAFEAAEVPLPALSAGHPPHPGRGHGRQRRDAPQRHPGPDDRGGADPDVPARDDLGGPGRADGRQGRQRPHADHLVDAGRGRVVPILQELAWTDGGRADRELAAALANRVLVEQFGLEAVTQDRRGGPRAVPLRNGRAHRAVRVRQPGRHGAGRDGGRPAPRSGRLAEWLGRAGRGPGPTRERRLLALAGLAGLGRPVLGEVRRRPRPGGPHGPGADLHRHRRALLRRRGPGPIDRAGPHRDARDAAGIVGPRGPGREARTRRSQTARLAIVAASLGDPVAAEMDAWVAANPPTTTTVALERALAARGWARRVAGAPAVAAVTVDGVAARGGHRARVRRRRWCSRPRRRRRPGWSRSRVPSWWSPPGTGPLDPAGLTPAKGQRLVRTVTPAGAIGPTDTVIVTLRVTLGPEARDECWRVTDLVPPGSRRSASAG